MYVGFDDDDDGSSTEPPTSNNEESLVELDGSYAYLGNEDDDGAATDPPTSELTTSNNNNEEGEGGSTIDDDGAATDPPTSELTLSNNNEEGGSSEGGSAIDNDGAATDPPTSELTLSNNNNGEGAAIDIDVSTESPESEVTIFDFDRTKFVAVEQLPTIGFRITVNKITKLRGKRKLKDYFMRFLKRIMDMGHNQSWYRFHSKSIGKITTELLPVWNGDVTNVAKGRSANLQEEQQQQKLVLLLDAFVFVHVNDQVVIDEDELQQPMFRDSFVDSLQIHLALWGFADLQSFLEETSGLENPVIESVFVGDTTIMGRDSDGNATSVISGIQKSSSAHGLSKPTTSFWSMLVILATSTLSYM